MSWGPPLVSHEVKPTNEGNELSPEISPTTIFSRGDRPRGSSRATMLASFASSLDLAGMDTPEDEKGTEHGGTPVDHLAASFSNANALGLSMSHSRPRLNNQVEWRITFLPTTLSRITSAASVGELLPLLSVSLDNAESQLLSGRRTPHSDSSSPTKEPTIRHRSLSTASLAEKRLLKPSLMKRTFFNLLAAFFGTGLLIIPFSFHTAGWSAILSLLLGALLYGYTAKILSAVLVEHPDSDSYLGLMFHILGRPGAMIGSICSWLLVMTILVEFVLISGSTLCHIIPSAIPCWLLHIAVSLLFLPTVFVVQFGGLYGLTLITLSYHVLIVVGLLLVGLTSRNSPGSLVEPYSTSFWKGGWQLLFAFTMQLHGLHTHFVFPECFRTLLEVSAKAGETRVSKSTSRVSKKIVDACYLVVFVQYTAVGAIGYLMWGPDTLPQIQLNVDFLDKDGSIVPIATGWSAAIAVVLAVTVIGTCLLKFGIFMNTAASAVEEVEEWLYVWAREKWARKFDDGFGDSDEFRVVLPAPAVLVNRIVLLGVCLGISLYLESFAQVVLFGAAITLPLAVVLPLSAHLKVFYRRRDVSPLWLSLLHMAGIVLAICLMVLAIVASMNGTLINLSFANIVGNEFV